MTRRTNQMEKPTLSNPTEQAPQIPPLDPPVLAESGRQPFETFLAGEPDWKVKALKAHTRWPAGYEATETEVKAQLDAALNEVIR